MKLLVAVIFLVLATSSCDLGSPPSTSSPTTIERSGFSNIVINLVDYDYVEVTHELGSNLYSSELIAVSIGTKDTAGYTELARTTSIYDDESHLFKIQFYFILKMDSSQTSILLTARYLLTDSTLIDIDTSANLYNYPYASAHVCVTESMGVPGRFQDCDVVGNKLYIHGTGAVGLYEYDLGTQQARRIFRYGGGDHIAADSCFVFCESLRLLFRFNILADSIDLTIPALPDRSSGLDAYNGYLYVLAGYPPVSMNRYTYDGVFVDSTAIHVPEDVYYMTIDHDIAYMTATVKPCRLKRYDLRTNAFMGDILAPGYDLMGIKIHQDRLYYCDLNKRYIGYVAVSDLRN